MNELIRVTQLPIIEERLKSMAAEIDKKVEIAISLVCTEETVKEVKAARADLNKQFLELEEQRKAVRKAVLEPYERFESVYDEFVKSKFKAADSALKSKIDEVQNELKSAKEKEVKEYFYEYLQSVNIDWIDWQMTDINITLSVSAKKLKEQAKEFVDRIVSDLSVIDMQEDATEILVEYKKTRNLQQSIQTVKDRKEQFEIMKTAEEARKAAEAERVSHEAEIEKTAELSAPKVEKPQEKPKNYKAVFTVIGTIEELKAVKVFLNERGIKYEC